MTIFKEEKIPGKGSECTSLSSLTIDDDLPGVSIRQIEINLIIFSFICYYQMKLQYIQGQNMLPSLNEEKNSQWVYNIILLKTIFIY